MSGKIASDTLACLRNTHLRGPERVKRALPGTRHTLTLNSICVMSKSKITAEQIKAARSLLGWSQLDLADAAEVSTETVHHVETGDANLGSRAARKIQRALQRQGILFLGSTGVKV